MNRGSRSFRGSGCPSGSVLRGGSTGFFSIFPSSTLCSENSEPVIDGSARRGGRGIRTVRPRNPQDRTGHQMGGKTGPECDKTISRYEGQGERCGQTACKPPDGMVRHLGIPAGDTWERRREGLVHWRRRTLRLGGGAFLRPPQKPY